MNGVPIGSKLPARRDAVAVTAAETPKRGQDWSHSINLTKANDRLTEFFDRNQGPQQVEQVLASALNGDLRYQHNLFIAMLDSWPKLQKNITEQARRVVTANWKVIPYSDPGQEPTPKAQQLAQEIESMIWGMRPDAARLEHGFEEMINSLTMGYYFGHAVEEINWYRAKDGMWKPKSTSRVPAKCYGYPYFIEDETDQRDRLMLNIEGIATQNFVDFPPNRFLIGINCGHPGHPSMAAPLRALAFYWLAAVRGLKWMMQFTQRFGVPWLHATADNSQKNLVAAALATIGTEGYLVTEEGVTLNPITAPQTGASLPQRELLKMADQAADVFILGQTLTSGTDDSGSRALGDVHAKTQDEMVDAVADYVGSILTYQLAPAIVSVNYGERDDMPQIWAKREEAIDEKAAAEVMKLRLEMGLPMEREYVYSATNTPIPAKGAELFVPVSEAPVEEEIVVEGDPAKPVQAAAAIVKESPELESLVENIGQGLTGVARKWLGPIKPSLMRLVKLAQDGRVSDADFIAELEKMQRSAPDMMGMLDAEALEESIMQAVSTAALLGSTEP
jgi:phage gp29-like protein